MPLPQFLRYRLAKRGIIHTSDEAGADKVPELSPPAQQEEEVIAEDYDSPKKGTSNSESFVTTAPTTTPTTTEDLVNELELKLWGHPGCPNKSNIYHECSIYCQGRWGSGHIDMDQKYLRLRQKMLLKYPLPLNWLEVYDPGTGRHYYWEYESDFVSWLPPGHPRAVITESAAFFRDAMLQLEEEAEDDDEDAKDSEEDDEDNEDVRPERRKEDERKERYVDDYEDRKRDLQERHKAKKWKKDLSDDEDSNEGSLKDDNDWKREPLDRRRVDELRQERLKEERERKRNGWNKVFDRTLDPMDPAAYSEAPRGTWSTGIERINEAKTGADTTAAGPLYQMRPYPSPGAVLRANSKSKVVQETHRPSKGRRAP